ncbi:MAG: hypothetical protein U0L12_04095 [Ruminococcus sp.]|nr:hypothetical protein [Ruminococcus sp.]
MSECMTEKEMLHELIDTFTNLQRIKKAENPQKELDFQLRIVKAKLEACGIVTTDLEL